MPWVHPVNGHRHFPMFQVSSALQKDLPYTLQSGTHSRCAITQLHSLAFPQISVLAQTFALSVENKLSTYWVCYYVLKNNKKLPTLPNLMKRIWIVTFRAIQDPAFLVLMGPFTKEMNFQYGQQLAKFKVLKPTLTMLQLWTKTVNRCHLN